MAWSKWEQLSERAQSVYKGLAALVAIGGIVFAAHGHFQTDAEAMQYRVQHNNQLQSIRIDQLEERIAQYRYQLLSANLTEKQREWIRDEIKRLNEQIACIRKGEC